MNIIIEPEKLPELKSKYTRLELDTVRVLPENKTFTAYCVIENIPIPDLPRVGNLKELHANLIVEYRKKNWNYCTQALEHLMGFWGGEADSFYQDLNQRIAKYIEQDPGESFDGIIEKTAHSQ
jgi:hypothetical protein